MFEFYRVYKGEFNYDNDAALTQENIEKLHGLMGRIKGSNLDDVALIIQIEQACEDAFREIFDESD